jgi:hypothetical protein
MTPANRALQAKFGWIFGSMKWGFYDDTVFVLSCTAIRLSCKFVLAVGKQLG